MGKESGLGAAYFVDGYNLSGDSREFGTISKAMKTLEVPGVDALSMERLPGMLDGEIAWTSYFNPTNAHEALSALPRTSRVATYLHRQTLGVPTASLYFKQANYDPKRAEAGDLHFGVQALGTDFWLDWGLTLTPGVRVDTAATNGTGVDFQIMGAPASFGLQAYLHVSAFAGTNVTIKLQQSSDNGVGDAFADVTGGTFAVVSSAEQGQVLYTARDQAVERYLRVVTTGTFDSVSFVVGATVNETDMTI